MDEYGLIGYPLGHSFSAGYFNEKFKRENINARYIPFPIDNIGKVVELISGHPNLRGLNVTIPYKQAIIPYLDFISPEAEAIGAVNVVKIIHREGKTSLHGYNSDTIGFRKSISCFEIEKGKTGIIAGSGGASKAVSHALQNAGLIPMIVSRNKTESTITYSELTSAIMDEAAIIVNATPLGMFPNIGNAPDLPYHLIKPKHICIDLVYNPAVTRFMELSASQGASVKNGLEMLYAQADASWEIWNKEN